MGASGRLNLHPYSTVSLNRSPSGPRRSGLACCADRLPDQPPLYHFSQETTWRPRRKARRSPRAAGRGRRAGRRYLPPGSRSTVLADRRQLFSPAARTPAFVVEASCPALEANGPPYQPRHRSTTAPPASGDGHHGAIVGRRRPLYRLPPCVGRGSKRRVQVYRYEVGVLQDLRVTFSWLVATPAWTPHRGAGPVPQVNSCVRPGNALWIPAWRIDPESVAKSVFLRSEQQVELLGAGRDTFDGGTPAEPARLYVLAVVASPRGSLSSKNVPPTGARYPQPLHTAREGGAL